MTNTHINALNLLGTPVSKRANQETGESNQETGESNSTGIDLEGVEIIDDTKKPTDTTPPVVKKEETNPWAFMDRYRGYDADGNLIVTPSGIGGGLAGMGALGGALLPGKDTPWWKRMLYSLAGAGILGTAGYFGGKFLGSPETGEVGKPGYVPGGWNTGIGGKEESESDSGVEEIVEETTD